MKRGKRVRGRVNGSFAVSRIQLKRIWLRWLRQKDRGERGRNPSKGKKRGKKERGKAFGSRSFIGPIDDTYERRREKGPKKKERGKRYQS